jgi:hypothetical protein
VRIEAKSGDGDRARGHKARNTQGRGGKNELNMEPGRSPPGSKMSGHHT